MHNWVLENYRHKVWGQEEQEASCKVAEVQLLPHVQRADMGSSTGTNRWFQWEECRQIPFVLSLHMNHLSKPHARPLQHTQASVQHSIGPPLGCASNKAEQGSWFFFLSHSASSSVELILRIAGISSKYKKTRLVSSSNQHREMSSQQCKAI